jgi:cytidylate kinase
VVTLSATFGAGGPIIGPAVAERLGVPFFDRAVTRLVAQKLGIPLEHAQSRDERVKGLLARVLASMSALSADNWAAAAPPSTARVSDADFFEQVQATIRSLCEAGGGVVLGRAAALVLREQPEALHVRLDGDPERRVRMAADHLGLSEAEARDAMEKIDAATAGYTRHFYGVDPASSKHYHLMLDSTRLPLDVCTEIIVNASMACRTAG